MEYVRYIQALIEEQKALGAVEGEVVSEYGHTPLIAPEAYNIYTFAPPYRRATCTGGTKYWKRNPLPI